MHALNRADYRAWQEFSATGRLILSCWLQSLYDNSPPHWTTDPYSPGVLGDLWGLFTLPEVTKYSRAQQHAIKRLAEDRHARDLTGILPELPGFDESNDVWLAYFQNSSGFSAECAQELGDGLAELTLTLASAPPRSVPLETILTSVTQYQQYLLSIGCGRYELYERINAPVLDIKGKIGGVPEARLAHQLRTLSRTSRSSHLCGTTVTRINEGPFGNNMGKKIAPTSLSSISDWNASLGSLVRIGSDVVAISSEYASHWTTAFTQHRHHLARQFTEAYAKSRVVFGAAPETSVVWRYAGEEKRFSRSIGYLDPFRSMSPVPPDGLVQLIEAIEEFHDRPHDALTDMVVAFDSRWGQLWPGIAVSGYLRRVRFDLSRIVAESIGQACRIDKGIGGLDGIGSTNGTSGFDYSALAKSLREMGPHVDLYLASRLEQIVSGTRPEFHWLRDQLLVARGIRNLRIHYQGTIEIPDSLMDTCSFLARLLIHMWSAALKVDQDGRHTITTTTAELDQPPTSP